jgi:uncharacterized membrane protein YfcA
MSRVLRIFAMLTAFACAIVFVGSFLVIRLELPFELVYLYVALAAIAVVVRLQQARNAERDRARRDEPADGSLR